MKLSNISMHNLWRLDLKLNGIDTSNWIRSDYAFRVRRIKDKVSVHINNRLGRK